jgi:chromosome segregation ATPase
MQYLTVWLVFTALLLSEAAVASASASATPQIQNRAQERAAALRSQLSEVEAKQSELKTRLQQLDENLKPENIANSLAGIGSTHPEELREQRRRQLEIERNGVRAQLDLLATSHTRLETAVTQAETEAYRQSAAPVFATPTGGSPTNADSTGAAVTPKRRRRVRKKRKSRRLHYQENSQ